MSENKTSKYFKYAIGEIVLVVIGILIALQINNWNEEKKLRLEEKKLVKSLIKEIESNLIIIGKEITDIKTIIEFSTKIIKLNDETQQNKFIVAEVLRALGYNTNKTEKSILNEILNTNSRALISKDSILIQLKSLKSAFENNDKTQFYVDEFWNTEVISYMNKKGLGLYFPSFKKKEKNLNFVEVDNAFFSLLGFMNGCQEAMLYSREDLKEELEKTLHSLKNIKSYD